MPETFETNCPEETIALGERLARRWSVGDCVGLVGQLGTGKTVLVRGIARGLGIRDERLVSSPTYVLAQEYPARVPVFHVDLYRLPAPGAGGPAGGEVPGPEADEEIEQLGLEEMLAAGVVLIEWAERAGEALPRPRWEVAIEALSETRRRFSLRRLAGPADALDAAGAK